MWVGFLYFVKYMKSCFLKSDSNKLYLVDQNIQDLVKHSSESQWSICITYIVYYHIKCESTYIQKENVL